MIRKFLAYMNEEIELVHIGDKSVGFDIFRIAPKRYQWWLILGLLMLAVLVKHWPK